MKCDPKGISRPILEWHCIQVLTLKVEISVMTLKEFIENDDQSYPGPLRALWLACRGHWGEAHEIAQSSEDPKCA